LNSRSAESRKLLLKIRERIDQDGDVTITFADMEFLLDRLEELELALLGLADLN
jgi:hypothetical protein